MQGGPLGLCNFLLCNPFKDLGMDLYITRTQQNVTYIRPKFQRIETQVRHVSSVHPPTSVTNTATKGTGDWAVFYLAQVLVRDERNATQATNKRSLALSYSVIYYR
jgi:hypothetical protein